LRALQTVFEGFDSVFACSFLTCKQEAKCCDGVVIRVTSLNVVSSLPALLPSSFGPRDLGRDVCMFERKQHGAVLQTRLLARDSLLESTLACLNAHCHAPYSGSLAAVGLAVGRSTFVCGAYLESAAYNPSLPPGQCALINLVATNGRFEGLILVFFCKLRSEPKKDIVRVVLLELRAAAVSHLDQTVALMKSIKVFKRRGIFFFFFFFFFGF
jgi:hypothetical protein